MYNLHDDIADLKSQLQDIRLIGDSIIDHIWS